MNTPAPITYAIVPLPVGQLVRNSAGRISFDLNNGTDLVAPHLAATFEQNVPELPEALQRLEETGH